jgi:hypothetical protein
MIMVLLLSLADAGPKPSALTIAGWFKAYEIDGNKEQGTRMGRRRRVD